MKLGEVEVPEPEPETGFDDGVPPPPQATRAAAKNMINKKRDDIAKPFLHQRRHCWRRRILVQRIT
jgi:hypothetical protein